MKNKILTQIEKIKKEKRLGIMTHIVLGYPNVEESLRLAKLMAQVGVDFIELQIPFSDPMADGPTIMKANKEALDKGFKVKQAFEIMQKLNQSVKIPLIFMSYFNTILNQGVENFMQKAKKSGASGLIFPDISIEQEGEEGYIKQAKAHNLMPIRVLSPASTEERIKLNAKYAQGFLYYVARKGITGAQKSMAQSLKKEIANLKKSIKISIAVGFGVSKQSHLKDLKKAGADIAVIGSAVLDVYNKAPKRQKLKKVEQFLKNLLK
jgi:tryptophan synthase alpha subunit